MAIDFKKFIKNNQAGHGSVEGYVYMLPLSLSQGGKKITVEIVCPLDYFSEHDEGQARDTIDFSYRIRDYMLKSKEFDWEKRGTLNVIARIIVTYNFGEEQPCAKTVLKGRVRKYDQCTPEDSKNALSRITERRRLRDWIIKHLQ